MDLSDTGYTEVPPEFVKKGENGAKEFLLVDKDGYSVVLFGCQLQEARLENLEYFRIMLVEKERN